jgi:hypothetical protein
MEPSLILPSWREMESCRPGHFLIPAHVDLSVYTNIFLGLVLVYIGTSGKPSQLWFPLEYSEP